MEFVTSNIGLIVNIIVFCVVFIVLTNMFKNTQKIKKTEKNLKLIQSKESKNFIKIIVSNSKYLSKIANDLDTKISICGFEETSYTVFQKSFLFSFIGIVLGIFILNPFALILFAIIGFMLPIINVNDRFYKKFKQIDEQILQALQLFLNEYQKTKNIVEVLENICPRLDYPIKIAFEKLLRKLNSGVDFKKALNGFADDLKNEWIYMFVNALIMNKENGSEITNVLMKTLTKIANKEIVQNENDMETFSGRILNRIMLFTVPAAFILVLIARPESKDLFLYTLQGKIIISVAIVLCVASFIMTRITEKM